MMRSEDRPVREPLHRNLRAEGELKVAQAKQLIYASTFDVRLVFALQHRSSESSFYWT